MKKRFYGLAALIIAVACYGVHVTYNSKNGLTQLTLLNVEALAYDEFYRRVQTVLHFYQYNITTRRTRILCYVMQWL